MSKSERMLLYIPEVQEVLQISLGEGNMSEEDYADGYSDYLDIEAWEFGSGYFTDGDGGMYLTREHIPYVESCLDEYLKERYNAIPKYIIMEKEELHVG